MITVMPIGSLSQSMLVRVSTRFLLQLPQISRLYYSDFRTNKPSDVISTLVSIYDSKELFVKELQVLLAQRLLAITDGSFEREVKMQISFDHSLFPDTSQSVAISRS